MSFAIVSGSPQTIWCPVAKSAGNVYVGQLVRSCIEGVRPIDRAEGPGDISHKFGTRSAINTTGNTTVNNNTILGVVIGTNKKVPTYSSTYKAEYIAFTQPNAAGSDDYFGTEGEWAKSDRLAMVKVALIDPTTIVRGRIFNASLGTAPGVQTITASGSTVLGHAAFETTRPAGFSTVYFRTGPAAGIYRVNRIASSTETEILVYISGSTATNALVGSKMASVNLKPWGLSRMQVSSTQATASEPYGLYIDSNASVATTCRYFLINVIRLNLASSGNEYCDFQFPAWHCQASMDTSGLA